MSILPIALPPVKSVFDEAGKVHGPHILHPKSLVSYPQQHAFTTVRPSTTSESIPFVVTCPHAGMLTANGFEDTIHEDIGLIDVLSRGDAFTDWMTVQATELGATQIICHTAPSFINMGRSTTSLLESEVRGGLKYLPHENDIYLNKGQGQGLIAVKTASGGKPIYAEDHVPDEDEIEGRIHTYYKPFHRAVEEQVLKNLQLYNYNLSFDIHSCPTFGSTRNGRTNVRRPDIIISNNDGHSCSHGLMAMTIMMADKYGLSLQMNDPYYGGFITQKYARNPKGIYADEPYGKMGNESIQIEFTRAAMGLNEKTLVLEEPAKYIHVQKFTNEIMNHMAGFARNRGFNKRSIH